MADIVDTLILGPLELAIITDRYHSCEVLRLTDSDHNLQRYQLVIQNEEEESYYNFLLDNCIAMSSSNFYMKAKTDKKFAARMKARIADEEP